MLFRQIRKRGIVRGLFVSIHDAGLGLRPPEIMKRLREMTPEKKRQT